MATEESQALITKWFIERTHDNFFEMTGRDWFNENGKWVDEVHTSPQFFIWRGYEFLVDSKYLPI